MGIRMRETCWAVFKRQVINLRSCCISLVNSVESMMMHGLANPKFIRRHTCQWLCYTHTHTHARARAHTHARARTRTHARAHTHTRAHAHTHTHTHTLLHYDVLVWWRVTLLISSYLANVSVRYTGCFESHPVCKGSAIEMFIIMFQDTWVKVYPFLMSRCFKGNVKISPCWHVMKAEKGIQVTLPCLDLGAGWGWVVNATLRWSCTSGILRTRKRTCFCRNITSISRIS